MELYSVKIAVIQVRSVESGAYKRKLMRRWHLCCGWHLAKNRKIKLFVKMCTYSRWSFTRGFLNLAYQYV